MTITPEAFLADPVHAVGEEPAPDEPILTPLERLADVEHRLARVEQRAFALEADAITYEEARTLTLPPVADSGLAEDESAAQLIDTSHELADLEAKHDVVLQLVERIGGIVKKSTSKVSLEVKAAIDEWANPETPSPAPDASPSEPQPEPIPAAVVEASAGEGPPWWEHSTVPPQAPANDAPVDEWRAYARSLGRDLDTMNRSQIRTQLGIEQPVGSDG